MYDIRNSKGTVIATINEKAVDTSSTSLVLHGRGRSPYGTKRNENIVHLLENFSNSGAPSNPIDGQVWWDSANRTLMVWDSTFGSPLGTWVAVVPPGVGQGFTIEAGAGLSGGGLPTGSPTAAFGSPETPYTIINVRAGTGIHFGSPTSPSRIATRDGEINHNALGDGSGGGISGPEHILHSYVTLTAGKGMTLGSPIGSPEGNITSDVTFNIVSGDGITVTADSVAVDDTMRTTGTQLIEGTKVFLSQIRAQIGAYAGAPAYSFYSDGRIGIYYRATNILSFVTGSTQRLQLESNGTLSSLNTTYEALVTDADDIPNKKYVDDALATIATPTNNTFIGVSSISGLDSTVTYYVEVYGVLPFKGTGSATLSAITLRRGSTTPGVGTIVDSTPGDFSFNWPDGHAPTSAGFFVEMNGDTSINCVVNNADVWSSQVNATWMTAVQITEIVPPGSPSALGEISLASVSGNTNPLAETFWPSAFDALATIRFVGTNAVGPGEAQHAGGNESALLVFSQIGSDWLISGSESDYELRVESVSTSGSGISIFGVLNSWVSLGTSGSWNYTLVKDGNVFGVGTWTIRIEIRQITDPSNTTGPVTYTLRAETII